MQCWCCPLAATECCPPVRVTPEDPAPTEGVPPREGVPTRSEGRVPAAAMGAMRPLHLLTVPAVRMPRAPTPPPPPCLLHLSPRLWPHQAVPRGPRGANPPRTHSATHFANPLFANPLSANPREPTANPPVSRTHLANPREPNAKHYGVSHANPLASGFEKSGFEQKWVRGKVGSSRDNPEPTWQAFRSGFGPPSSELRAQSSVQS